jgi:hypothetical protein
LAKQFEEHPAIFIKLRSIHPFFRLKRILSVLLIVSVGTLLLPSVAYADIAPPRQSPGFNPAPGSKTDQLYKFKLDMVPSNQD